MNSLHSTPTAGTSTPTSCAADSRPSRFSDIEIARLWVESIDGELYFSTTCDHPRTGEFWRYLPVQKDGIRCRIKYLPEVEVESRILQFCLDHVEEGAKIRISPNKVRTIRTLAAWLIVAGGQAR